MSERFSPRTRRSIPAFLLGTFLLAGCGSNTEGGDAAKETIPIIGVVTVDARGAKVAGICVRHEVGLPGSSDYNVDRLVLRDPTNQAAVSLTNGALVSTHRTSWSEIINPGGESQLIGDGSPLEANYTLDGIQCTTPVDTTAGSGDFVILNNNDEGGLIVTGTIARTDAITSDS